MVVFKTSIDDADFQAVLARMEAGAAKTSKYISKSLATAGAGGAAGFASAGTGGYSASNKDARGFHPSVRVLGDTINAVTGGTGAVMELRALEGLTGMTLAAAAAAVVAFKSYEHFSEAIGKVREESAAAAGAFGHLNSTIVAAGPETAGKQIETLEEHAKKLEESRTMSAQVGNAFKRGAIGNLNIGLRFLGQEMDNPDAILNSKSLQAKSEKQAQEIREESIASIKEETAERAKYVGMSERDVKLSENRLKLRKEQAQIELKYPAGISAALKEQARVEADNRETLINHEIEGKEKQRSLENQIVQLGTSGRFKGAILEERIAHARIDAAKEEAKSALNPEERAEAEAKAGKIQAGMQEKALERTQKIKEEMHLGRIEAERHQDDMETAQVREDFANRKKVTIMQAEVDKEKTVQGLRVEAQMGHDLSEVLSHDRDEGIRRAGMSTRARHAEDRARAREKRVEERYDRQHPGERRAIADARSRERAAKDKLSKLEATIKQGDIDSIIAGFNAAIAR